MELKDFVVQQQDELDDFMSWWAKQRKKYPRDYPMFNSPNEWAAQFKRFQALRSEQLTEEET